MEGTSTSVPQAQITQQHTQQNRERKAQLYDQWEEICQRQQEAHVRNRQLLRDFRRVEKEMTLLAAKTDSFRRKRDEYKKELHRFLSLHTSKKSSSHWECADPPETPKYPPLQTSHEPSGPWKQNASPEACKRYNYLTRECGTGSNSLKGSSHFPTAPLSCWCILYPYPYGLSGGHMPDDLKVQKAASESPSQKMIYKRASTPSFKDSVRTSDIREAGVDHCLGSMFNVLQTSSRSEDFNETTKKDGARCPEITEDITQCICAGKQNQLRRGNIFNPQLRNMSGEGVCLPGTKVGDREDDIEETPVRLCAAPSDSSSQSKKTSPAPFPMSQVISGQSAPLFECLRTAHSKEEYRSPMEIKQSIQTGNGVETYGTMTMVAIEKGTSQEAHLAPKENSDAKIKMGLRSLGISYSSSLINADDGVEADGIKYLCQQDSKKTRIQKEKCESQSETTEESSQQKVLISAEDKSQSEAQGDLLIINKVSCLDQEYDESEGQERSFVEEVPKVAKTSVEGDTESVFTQEASNEYKNKVTWRSDRQSTLHWRVMMDKEDTFDTNSPSDTDVGSDIPYEDDGETSVLDEGMGTHLKGTMNVVCEHDTSSENKEVQKPSEAEPIVIQRPSDYLMLKETEREKDKKKLQKNRLKTNEYMAHTEQLEHGFTKDKTMNANEMLGCERLNGMGEGEIDSNCEEKEEGEDDESSTDEKDNILIVQEKGAERQQTKEPEEKETETKDYTTSEEEECGSGEDYKVISGSSDRDRKHEKKCKFEVRRGNMEEDSFEKEEEAKKHAMDEETEDEEEQEEDEDEEQFSDEETSDCGDDEDEVDGDSEEEENTDFWGQKDDDDDGSLFLVMEVEEENEDERCRRTSHSDAEEQKMREESCSVPESAQEKAAVLCLEDAHTELERSRTHWLCCLEFCNKREIHSPEKRCSADCVMDALQMNPIESGSSLAPLDTPPSPVPRNEDMKPVTATHIEATPQSDSESVCLPGSESDDDVHSFYD